MRRIDIFHTSDIDGGTEPFEHGELQIMFHRWSPTGLVGLLDGMVWAFVDWSLPSMSGLEVCRRMRCEPSTSNAHITIVLDDDDQESRRRALRAGADDYIAAPLTRRILLDRVLSSEVRNYNGSAVQALELGDLKVDVAAYRALWQGKPIALMPNEFRLLRFFVEHPGRVFTRHQLIAALGKGQGPIDERTVDVWIGRLRSALRKAGVGEPLRTVRALGYALDLP